MKHHQLLIYPAACLVILASACGGGNRGTNSPVNTVTPKPTYTITEDFESGTKTSYDMANVNLATGEWTLDGALTGTDANDAQAGNRSVRLQGTPGNDKRNGIITMNFDIRHLSSFSIKTSLAYFPNKTGSRRSPLQGSVEVQKSTDGGNTFTQIGETIICDTEPTSTRFTVTDSVVRFRIINTSDLKGGSHLRINIDDIVFTGNGDPGLKIAKPDTVADNNKSVPADIPPVGVARPVTIESDAPPATGDNSNMLFGNPSGAQASLAMRDNYLIDMGYYTESYNATRGTPNWVSWHLDRSNTTNASGRLDNFAAWAGLPAGFYAVQNTSYSGSGFDKGHNCPSADRTSSVAANAATFLMTNMVPQAPQNNEHTWGNLESYLRLQTLQGNEVYIIMGSYGIGGTGSHGAANTINKGHITVPSNIWKVAVIIPAGNADLSRVSAATRVIAVNTPNINTINPDWKKYVVSVRSIEQATGYNLLSALPQNVQDAVEGKADVGL